MSSVLVDFYNLNLKSGWLRESPEHIEFPQPLEEVIKYYRVLKKSIPPNNIVQQDFMEAFEKYAPSDVKKLVEETNAVSKTLPPSKEEQQRIIKLFKTYTNVVAEEWTAEEKQQFKNLEASLKARMDSFPGIQDNTLQNIKLYTLEGYKEITGISWFDSINFAYFAEEYYHIKKIIDEFLSDRDFTSNSLHWLEMRRITDSTRTFYNRRLREKKEKAIMIKDSFTFYYTINKYLGKRFIIDLPPLFSPIYDETISVLKGELKIQRCQRNSCNNITLKRWNREYCDTCRPIAKKEVGNEYKKAAAKRIHIQLCFLIDEWLPQKSEETIDAASLMLKLRQISTLKKPYVFLQSARSMGRYLNRKEVEEMLKARGIRIKVVDKNKKGATYKFKRTQ